MQQKKFRRGFTLIELLVVIAIIAILAAILFPVFAQAKVAAKKTTMISNQKQVALAFMMYSADSDDVLPFLTWYDSFRNDGTLPGETVLHGDTSYVWTGAQPYPVSLIPYHKNDTKNGNLNSFLISPSDTQRGNLSKPEFANMLRAVNWPKWDQWSVDALRNATIFPLSICANYNLNYTFAQNADGTWPSGGPYSGPRSMTSISSPASTVLTTEYGVGDAWGNGRTYSNYYCALGYGGVDRWRNGRRYNDGRTFSFTDGHVKFMKDPNKIENLSASNGPIQVQVRESYANVQVFDIAERSSK